jgi:hypothetical protein
MRIIDAHTHIYPDKIAERASQSISDFYGLHVKHDGTLKRLLSLCERNNIEKCVTCAVATTPEQAPIINDFLAQTAASSGGKLIALCALHPDMTGAEIEAELRRAKSLDLKGIKLHPDFQRFRIDDRNVYKIYERAEGNFPILFHTGDKRYEFSQPAKLAKVLRDFPKLTAIGAHFGGWSEWGDVECLRGFENLYVDTSSSLYELSPAEAEHLIKLFGEERVMFGTDYPMWDAGGELKYIGELNLSQDVQKLIFHKNAERLYDL